MSKVENLGAKKDRSDRLKKRHRKMTRLVNRHCDWDYSEIYELLEKKLTNILEYAKTDSVAYEHEWRPQWIERAIALASHLAHDHKYPSHININNSKRFKDASHLKFHHEDQSEYIQKINSETFKNSLVAVDFDRLDAEDFYDIKARHLFFKILTNYIEYWWD